jgi:DNA-binding CsgD family transcriptional regulator
MPTQAFPYSFIYNDEDKVQHYWNQFKPLESNSLLLRESWKPIIPFLERVSTQNCVQVLLWNILSNHLIYESDKRNVVGYDASLYLGDNGVDFLISKFHPVFLTAILTLLLSGFNYLISNKQDIYRAVINIDFLYRKSNGVYMHCLQQTTCIEADNNEHPILLLSYIHDITYIKKEKTSNLVITTPEELKWWNYNFDINCIEVVQSLSKQETKILACLADGKSSKAIAKELFISPLTVDTHRRHLLHKTSCLNTTGMITYAKLVGLL